MADRVRPLKLEAPATGGTELDEFPRAVNPNEDQVDVRGVVLQNDTSNDEDVVITRDASSPDNMTFQDEVETTPVTLSQLLGGPYGRAVFKVDGGIIYTTQGAVVLKENQ